jgi:hypothetical protein
MLRISKVADDEIEPPVIASPGDSRGCGASALPLAQAKAARKFSVSQNFPKNSIMVALLLNL